MRWVLANTRDWPLEYTSHKNPKEKTPDIREAQRFGTRRHASMVKRALLGDYSHRHFYARQLPKWMW